MHHLHGRGRLNMIDMLYMAQQNYTIKPVICNHPGFATTVITNEHVKTTIGPEI